jgi:glycosyltransferase involved in cell wall biosynthesis
LRKKADNIKILFVGRFTESEILSGPARIARSLFTEYTAEHQTIFLQYFFDGRKYSVFKKLFGKERIEHGKGHILTLGLFRVIPFLVVYRPAVIHLVQFERFALLLYIYRLFFNVQIIYNSHGVIQYENTKIKKVNGSLRSKDNLCEKMYLKCSDLTIFPSEATREIAIDYYAIDKVKTAIIPNFAGIEFSAGNHVSFVNGIVKLVIQYKNEFNKSGIELLLRSAKDIKCKAEVYIITNTELELPVSDNLTFFMVPLMTPTKLAEFYLDKDVFLSLNSYDTFSIATAEAMASGLIPVVTNETGISRYINHGINGFKFDYAKDTEFPGIMNDLSLMSKDQIINFSKAAAETAAEFKIDRVFSRYKEIYGVSVK